MVDFNAWRGSRTTSISAADRAVSLWGIIQRDPTSLVIERGGTELDPQDVRIEVDNTVPSDTALPTQKLTTVKCVVYGVKDHPATDVVDTDIEVRDRFWLNDMQFEVRNVLLLPGQIQARCEALI